MPEQVERWNGPAGEAWVEAQETLDGMFKPLEALLAGTVAAGTTAHVLDVGCGTGATTIAAARRVGPSGRATGIDISEPMIAAARARAGREGVAAGFIRANAQDYEFAPASVDLIISRFGVMFFDDPVKAFANLRRAATGNGELRCLAWRSAAENPFMTTAERAAATLLPGLTPRQPNVPGQFAFADGHRVRTILSDSGWTEVEVQSIDVACSLPEADLTLYLSRLGPVGLALRDADEPTRARVVAAVRPAFEPYVDGSDVRFTAACWLLRARATDRGNG